jgi:hypothetical protein
MDMTNYMPQFETRVIAMNLGGGAFRVAYLIS